MVLPQLPVLIVGSGLGGLTLAHSLQNWNIPYRIFERDGFTNQRAQGYRISIDEGGASGLKAACTPEVYELFEKTSAEEHHAGARVNAINGTVERGGILGLLGTGGAGMIYNLLRRYLWKRYEQATLQAVVGWLKSWFIKLAPSHPVAPNGANRDYKIDRRVLRSVLLKSLSQHVIFDHEFSHYTLSSENTITAHFTNGSSVTGSLLVGADGIGSKVAGQLIGADVAVPVDLGARIIYGKTPLTSQVEGKLNPALLRGASFVVDDQTSSKRKLMTSFLVKPPNLASPNSFALYGSQAKEVVDEMTKSWHPCIKVILDEQSTGETAMLRMTSSHPTGPPVWDTQSRVTVPGDAIHCMPPTGGQGANSAMKDAAMLGEILRSNSSESLGWSVDTIRKYEDAVRYEIGDIVGLACVGASGILRMDLSHIVDSRRSM